MSLIRRLFALFRKEDEATELEGFGKLPKLATALAATATAAWAGALPTTEISGELALPKELVALIIIILVLLFVSTKERLIDDFTRTSTLVIAGIGIVLFLFNVFEANNLAVKDTIGEWHLKGLGSYPGSLADSAASRYAEGKYSDPDLLNLFHRDASLVWTVSSRNYARLVLDVLYIIGTITLSLSIIAAFDVFKANAASKPQQQPATTPPAAQSSEK